MLGGSWLTDLLLDVAPRLPFRDGPTLRAQHPGLSDDDLAQALISGAAKSSATIGAAGGALAAVEFTAPPTLLTAPAQLAAETLLVAAVEIKLIAELHEVYGVPATGPLRGRAHGLRRGVVRTPRHRPAVAVAAGSFSLGASAKRALRNRLIRLAGRNLTTLGPLMSGAVAGSMVNHRETRRLGEQVRDDLRSRGRTIPRRDRQPLTRAARASSMAAASSAGRRLATNQYGVGSAGSRTAARTPPGTQPRIRW